jgi:hypothetical protein
MIGLVWCTQHNGEEKFEYSARWNVMIIANNIVFRKVITISKRRFFFSEMTSWFAMTQKALKLDKAAK